MAKWKLCRQTYGKDIYEFTEGDEVTIGRGTQNTIILPSLNISRKHCVITVKKDEVIIVDLQSANGIFVGLKKIAPNVPFSLCDNDIIGLGWTDGAPLALVNDAEKYVFKLQKISSASIIDRIQFQSENELLDIKAEIDIITNSLEQPFQIDSKLTSQLSLKRKSYDGYQNHNTSSKEIVNNYKISQNDASTNCTEVSKRLKTSFEFTKIKEEPDIEFKNEDMQYEAFEIKQENLDDELLIIDSDSDSEQWYARLSQSSPRKSLTDLKEHRNSDCQQDSSYSQLDDDVIFVGTEIKKNIESDEEHYSGDLITILPPSVKKPETDINNENLKILPPEDKHVVEMNVVKVSENLPTDLTSSCSYLKEKNKNTEDIKLYKDNVKKQIVYPHKPDVTKSVSVVCKKLQLVDLMPQTRNIGRLSKSKINKKRGRKKSKSPKVQITNSQKEERKKKLHEIASKGKGTEELLCATDLLKNDEISNTALKVNDFLTVNKKTLTVKSIRLGAFLTETHPAISADKKKQYKIRIPFQTSKPESKSTFKPILKPININKEPNTKYKKQVRFSDVQPEIRLFEIEQGNQLKKTNTVKSALIPTRHNMPVYSVEKMTLMKILRWNPQWLEEQNNFSEPPPILGHNNVPMALLHSFDSHTQYVQLLGDLLLMEIWECLTQGYIKTRKESRYLEMRIESAPLFPHQKLSTELINLSVNVALPTSQAKSVPREGEIMIVQFSKDVPICRFFYVQHVRCLPSPTNNTNSFYSISLQTCCTEKMRTLQRGAVMFGQSLAYINKDLRLFEAIQYLSKSPLIDVILNPQPKHFIISGSDCTLNIDSQWTKPLNSSQKKAVRCAVSAAFEDTPRIQMVQGPPGTGKSRVICAIVMSYFYDGAGKKQKDRGKILICATSNAAVDELVARLLDIRQSLPHPERLNMVRVGRVEAMTARARDISSLKLAQRDAARLQPEPAAAAAAAHGLSAEISLLEAKKNMWQSKAMYTKDYAREVYCQSRVAEITKKIAMFRSSAGGGVEAAGGSCTPEQLAQAERRVLEGADVVLTTLASAHSHKMRGFSLCIVDEAGQAIEPETLVPLTLDVTRLVLVGDPQQLPGFICSHRARNLGLGESLFSRLSSSAETWREEAVVLLDRQYRMHPHIADFPNRAFYGGLLHDAPRPPRDLRVPPYVVLGVMAGDHGQDAAGANDTEAWAAARVARALRAAAPSASLAVLTPYAAQRELVRTHLRTLHQGETTAAGGEEAAGDGELEVATVDSFQGQERDVVVVSLARSAGTGFLAAAGRINVLLTRARHALVLCLNPLALEKNLQWRSLVEDAQNRKLYGTLPLHICQHPLRQQVSNHEMLQYLNFKHLVNNTVNTPHQSFEQTSRKNHNRQRHRRGQKHILR